MTRRLFTRQKDWDALRAAFSWDIPERFNLARACVTDWAATDRVALTHLDAEGARDWTFARLDAASDAYAAALLERGVERGDRVATLLPQGPEVLISYLASWKIGAIAVPLFTLFGPDALAFRLVDSGAAVLLTDAENRPKIDAIRGDLADLKAVYETGRGFDRLCASGQSVQTVDTLAEDPAIMIYTSGTTGPPKGTLHAHRFLFGHLPSVELTHGFFPQEDSVGWTPADWAWIGGLMDMCVPCLYYGVRQASAPKRKFDADAAFGLLHDQRVTNAFIPPTALKMMMRAKVPQGLVLRSISSGGESLGTTLHAWARESLGVEIAEIYGQTECNLTVASVAGLMPEKPGAIGRPVPGVEVRIIDANGAEQPRGTLGEIAIHRDTPATFLAYWNQPRKTQAKFIGDWLKTGDLGVMDADGMITFHARDDDLITSAGYRVGPSEIENCLMGHPRVAMAACVGVPDAERTEIVKAVVVLKDGAADEALVEELKTRVRDRISPHVAPRIVEFAESLPMTATGKIMRRALRD